MDQLELNKKRPPTALVPASAAVLTMVLVVVGMCLCIDRANSQRWRNRPRKSPHEIKFKTGDILLFSGRSFAPLPTISFVIKLITNSDISHVGLVWQDPLTGQHWVWHTSGIPSKAKTVHPKDDKRKHYAHLMTLQEALNPRWGRVYLRPCSHELDPHRMAQFIRENLGRDYSFDIALHWYNRKLGIAPLHCLETEDGKSGATTLTKSSKWSCAELVVNCLCHMGVMPPSELVAAHSYMPNDFSSNNFLRLSSDISYGREIYIGT